MRSYSHAIWTVILVAALSLLLLAAGNVTTSVSQLGDTDNYVISVSWTGDSSDGTVPTTFLPASGGSASSFDGYSIVAVVTKPGATAPTSLYDVAILDSRGLDLMGGACANRSASAAESCSSDPVPISGPIRIAISGNSVSGAAGTVHVYLVRQTVAKRGGSGASSSGESGQYYSWDRTWRSIVAGTGVEITHAADSTVAADTAVMVQFSSGTSVPESCTDGALFWETDAQLLWRCQTSAYVALADLTSGKLALAKGGTNADLSTTGGATHVLRQASTGAPVTVGALVATDIPSLTQPQVDGPTFCTDAGSNDSYACNLSPAISAYVTGAHYRFKAATANTGAATLALNGLTAITIVKVAGGITTALTDNDIRAGQWVDIVYDGTNMQMQSLLGNAASGATIDVQTFTEDGTWTKPSPCTDVTIIGVGGGGGGGGGRRGAADTNRSGGGGGGGGAWTMATIPCSLLASTATVDVGAAGSGAAVTSSDDTNGASGSNGAASTVTSNAVIIWRAGGGGYGAGGNTSSGTIGAASTGGNPGTAGGQGNPAAGSQSYSATGWAAAGGGGGGGVNSSNVVSAGGAGAGRGYGAGADSTSGAASACNNGSTATAATANWPQGGGGGGGGAGCATAAAGNGANAAIYGGGGGGGGGSLNGYNGGSGGNGAAGIVVVISR